MAVLRKKPIKANTKPVKKQEIVDDEEVMDEDIEETTDDIDEDEDESDDDQEDDVEESEEDESDVDEEDDDKEDDDDDEDDDEDEEEEEAPKKSSAKKVPAKKVVSKKAPAKKEDKKSSAKKAPAKKEAPKKKTTSIDRVFDIPEEGSLLKDNLIAQVYNQALEEGVELASKADCERIINIVDDLRVQCLKNNVPVSIGANKSFTKKKVNGRVFNAPLEQLEGSAYYVPAHYRMACAFENNESIKGTWDEESETFTADNGDEYTMDDILAYNEEFFGGKKASKKAPAKKEAKKSSAKKAPAKKVVKKKK